MTANIKSAIPLSNCRYSLTQFNGFYDTVPQAEITDVPFSVIVANVAPVDDCLLIEDKDHAPYFVPCELRAAPFTGKTAERAAREGWGKIGKQRSGQHVCPSGILKYDLDGITQAVFVAIRAQVEAAEIAHLGYSTHSNGRADKPGVRARLLVPLDRALSQAEYSHAWAGFAELMFPDATLDKSAANIHQQQGVWCTSKDRAHLAFRFAGRGAPASADALIQAAPVQIAPKTQRTLSGVNNSDLIAGVSTPPLERLRIALDWLDANDRDVLVDAGLWLKVLADVYGESVAFDLWIEWSRTSAKFDDADAAMRWAGFDPYLGTEAAVGCLLAAARDATVSILKRELNNAELTAHGKKAAIYLAQHHRRAFGELRGNHGGN